MRQILHLSDVHFGPPHLAQTSAALLDFIDRRRPHLVVISGDLTQRAKPLQFREARRWVDRIPVPTLAVPGNHDVPLYRFWERFFAPYGAYRKGFSPDLEPTFEDDELLVVGVNTAFNWTFKNGRITRRQLAAVRRRFSAADPRVLRVVVAHHQIVPPPWLHDRGVLRGARAAAAGFAEAGVDLVLSGHLHQAYFSFADSYYPEIERPLLVLNAGTATSDRGRGNEVGANSANWVEVDDERLVITHLDWLPEAGTFRERSEHRFPRRLEDPQALASET